MNCKENFKQPKRGWRAFIRHHANDAHLYCRLRSLGIGKEKTRKLTNLWKATWIYTAMYKI